MSQVSRYTHPILTNGQPVDILPLPLAGLKALVKRRAELAALQSADGPKDPVTGIEVFELMAFYTLSRVVPNLTPEKVGAHLDVSDMQTLLPLIQAANGKGDAGNATRAA